MITECDTLILSCVMPYYLRRNSVINTPTFTHNPNTLCRALEEVSLEISKPRDHLHYIDTRLAS